MAAQVQIRGADPPHSTIAWSAPIQIPQPLTAPIQLVVATAEGRFSTPGGYEVGLSIAEGPFIPMERWTVLGLDPREVHDQDMFRLDRVQASHPQFALAIASARARVQWLTPNAAQSSPSPFFLDAGKLMIDLESEIAAIEHGDDPYAERPGDRWVVATLGARALPIRVARSVQPARLAGDFAPSALVWILASDAAEAPFFESAWRTLPALQGQLPHPMVIIAIPLPEGMLPPPLGPAIVDLVARFNFDPAKTTLLVDRVPSLDPPPDLRLCVVGVPPPSKARTKPLLIVGGEWDETAPPEVMAAAAESALHDSPSVEYLNIKTTGRALLTSNALKDIIDWATRN